MAWLADQRRLQKRMTIRDAREATRLASLPFITIATMNLWRAGHALGLPRETQIWLYALAIPATAAVVLLICRRHGPALLAALAALPLAWLVRYAYLDGETLSRSLELVLIAGMVALCAWLADQETERAPFSWLLAYTFGWLVELVLCVMGFVPPSRSREILASAASHLLGPGAPYFDLGVTGLLYLLVVGYGWGTGSRT